MTHLPSCAKSANILKIIFLDVLSKAPVGSSANIIRVFERIALAIANFCFSPPDNEETGDINSALKFILSNRA